MRATIALAITLCAVSEHASARSDRIDVSKTELTLRAGITERLKRAPIQACKIIGTHNPDSEPASANWSLVSDFDIEATGMITGTPGRHPSNTNLVVYTSRELSFTPNYRIHMWRHREAGRDLFLGFVKNFPWKIRSDHPSKYKVYGDLLVLPVDVVKRKSGGYEAVSYDRTLHCSLDILSRDTDGDGLFDVEEERLVTDPQNPDTDGDGVGDLEDPSPLGGEYARSLVGRFLREVLEDYPLDEMVGGRLYVHVSDELPRVNLGRDNSVRHLILRAQEALLYRQKFPDAETTPISVAIENTRATLQINTVRAVFLKHGDSWVLEQSPSP